MEVAAELPILRHRAEITEAVQTHQVVVVAGETGSGKSTQLPQFMLEMGYATVGVTQPRRLAARAIAARLADELKSSVGGLVGLVTRADAKIGADTQLKVMTDGILLNEFRRDRALKSYQALMIDEAHERSLNIDFILGYLSLIRPQRPDLRIVITSATLDPERLGRYFDTPALIEVSGRGYPVEIRYCEPPTAKSATDPLVDTVRDLLNEGKRKVLVFLPGEREIMERRDMLRRVLSSQIEILPLYSRLPRAAQDRIHAVSRTPKIILSTNVAETSLTIAGVDAVVDDGTARISRFSPQSQIQRLPIEPISQAAATQRAGRAGREAPGVCVRLYTEASFNSRPVFNEPEIQRTNLATVILKLLDLRVGSFDEFPFIDPPPPRLVKAGFRVLDEIGAINDKGRITRTGRALVRLSVDPVIGRMLQEAHRRGCLQELLAIASALSIQEPREWPSEATEKAGAAYAAWSDKRSDFLWYLNFWTQEVVGRESWGRLKKKCQECFISYARVREWIDLHKQLSIECKRLGWRVENDNAEYKSIHLAILSGLYPQVAKRESDDIFRTARGTTFLIAPTSSMFRAKQNWIVAMQLIETHTKRARCVAKIKPSWIKQVAGDRLVLDYGETSWDETAGAAFVITTRRLFRLIVDANVRLPLAKVAPEQARQLLISEGIIGRQMLQVPKGIQANYELIDRIRIDEAKLRRDTILINEQALASLYDDRLPESVCDGATLVAFADKTPERLQLSNDDLRRSDAASPDSIDYPDFVTVNGREIALVYRFQPGEDDDGVSARVPISHLQALDDYWGEWVVPGYRAEIFMTYLRSLPKATRRRIQPLGARVDQYLGIQPRAGESVAMFLRRMLADAGLGFDEIEVLRSCPIPDHLQLRFEVIDDSGQTLGVGRDLQRLKAKFGQASEDAFDARASRAAEEILGESWSSPTSRWCWEELPTSIPMPEMTSREELIYLGLVDEMKTARVRVFATEAAANEAHRQGVVRLAHLGLAKDIRYALKRGLERDRLDLLYLKFGDPNAMLNDLAQAVITDNMFRETDAIRTRRAFDDAISRTQHAFVAHVVEMGQLITSALQQAHEIVRRVADRESEFASEVTTQVSTYFTDSFVTRYGLAIVREYPRYLGALEKRIERHQRDPRRDRELSKSIRKWEDEYAQLCRLDGISEPCVRDGFSLLEEWRISLFAQELKTKRRVSEKKLTAWFEDAKRD